MTSLDFAATSDLLSSTIGISLAEFALTWWLQSALLLSIGLLAVKAFKSRGPAIQSWICRATLVAVIACPLSTYLLSLSGKPLLTIDLQSRFKASAEIKNPADFPTVTKHVDTNSPAEFIEHSDFLLEQSNRRRVATSVASRNTISDHSFLDMGDHSELKDDAATTPITSRTHDSRNAKAAVHSRLALIFALAIATWLLGSVYFCIRLLSELSHGERLRRKSHATDDLAKNVCHDVATTLNVRTPRVLTNPFINSPCLLGHWRPAVLLPAETSPSAFREVFLHELAHLRRRDWPWAILGRLTQAALWFQPLMWVLLRRDAVVAEEVCDDYVLHFGGNRDGYLKQLVEIAERTLPQPAAAGIAMVSFQSKLGHRSRRILDTTRALSTTVGRWFACTALFVTLIATILVASVYVGKPTPASGQGETLKTPTEVTSENPNTRFRGRGLEPEASTAKDSASVNQNTETLTFVGQVLLPNGQPAAGAEIFHIFWYPTPHKRVPIEPVATTDDDGRFHIQSSAEDVPAIGWLVCRYQGHGLYLSPLAFHEPAGTLRARNRHIGGSAPFVDMAIFDQGPIRLVENDKSISGRILDLEGNPVVDAIVSVEAVQSGVDNTLNDFEAMAKTPAATFYRLRETMPRWIYGPMVPSLFPETRTDNDGQFHVTGLGNGRLAKLVVRGRNIEAKAVFARTTAGERLVVPSEQGQRSTHDVTYFGTTVSLVVAPSRPVIGTITDRKTGRPVRDVVLTSNAMFGLTANGTPGQKYGSDEVFSVTDADGNYRLDGLPRSSSNRVSATDAKQRYLADEGDANTAGNDLEPVVLDFKLNAGKRIRGRVTDQNSIGVVGALTFLPAPSKTRSRLSRDREVGMTRPSGRYDVLVPPGSGNLCFRAQDWTQFHSVATPGHQQAAVTMMPVNATFNAVAEVHGSNDHDEIALIVRRQTRLTGRAVAPKGDALDDIEYVGRNSGLPRWNPSRDGVIEILGYDKTNVRRILALSRQRKLSGFHELKGEAPQGFEVKLVPWATVKGRVVDSNGEPVRGVAFHSFVDSTSRKRAADGAMAVRDASEFRLPLPTPSIISADDGTFEVVGLSPGHSYNIMGAYQPDGTLEFYERVIVRDLKLKPGENRDLGTINLEAERPSKAAAKKPRAAEASAAELATRSPPTLTSSTRVIKGRVIVAGQDQLPASGIHLYKGSAHIGLDQSKAIGPLPIHQETGVFSITMSNQPNRDLEMRTDVWIDHGLFAIAAGYGLGFLYEDRGPSLGPQTIEDVELHLVPDDAPIHGRILDPEGNPVAGVEVSVRNIHTNSGGSLSPLLASLSSKRGTVLEHVRETLPHRMNLQHVGIPLETLGVKPVVSNDDGRFVVRGVGRERLVEISVAGNGVQQQQFFVATRDMPPVANGSFDSSKMEFVYGANCTLIVAQGITITGTVRDRDTKQPLTGVTVRDSQLNNAGGHSMANFTATTDIDGRYRITGFPRTGHNRLIAVPTDEQPYFMRDIRVEPSDKPGSAATTLDFELQRGIWITGKVTDKQSGKPVQADLYYFPFLDNKFAQRLPEVRGNNSRLDSSMMQHRFRSKLDGRYRIVGLPGHAIVGVNNAMGPYLTGVGAHAIQGMNEQGAFATFRNPIQASDSLQMLAEINPSEGEDSVHVIVNFALERGERRVLELVDSDGIPLLDAHVSGHFPTANYRPVRQSLPSVDVVCLKPTEKRKVLIQHLEKKLASVVYVSVDQNENPTIVKLEKAASIRGRLVDANDDPMEGVTVVAGTVLIRHHVEISKTTTDQDGFFMLDSLPGPIDVQLKIQNSDSSLPDDVTSQRTAAGAEHDLGIIVVE